MSYCRVVRPSADGIDHDRKRMLAYRLTIVINDEYMRETAREKSRRLFESAGELICTR